MLTATGKVNSSEKEYMYVKNTKFNLLYAGRKGNPPLLLNKYLNA